MPSETRPEISLNNQNLTHTLRRTRRAIKPSQIEDKSTMRLATVTATPGGGVCTIQLGGNGVDVAEVKYVTSYTPVISDTVVVMKTGPDLVIIGKLS